MNKLCANLQKKGPNDKATNLSEDNWLNVRTRRFKNWFGDWDLKNKSVEIVKAKLKKFNENKEAKEWAVKNGITGIFNSSEFGEYEITASAIDKYLHDSSVKNSDNRELHHSVLRVLPTVINNSIEGETHPDYNKGADGIRRPENGFNPDVNIHRLFGAVNIGGKTYRVKTTLKSYRDVNQKSKPYTYEVTKIELLDGKLANAKTDTDPNINNSITAAKLLQNVEKSYKKGKFILDDHSKVVDENGEPLEVYNGGRSEITEFNHAKARQNRETRNKRDAFFFTNSKINAEDYAIVNRNEAHPYYWEDNKGANITPVFLNLRDIVELDAKGEAWNNVEIKA